MKLKKLNLSEIKNEFQEIERTEQMLFIGRTRWTLDSNGNLTKSEDGSPYDTIAAGNYTMTMLRGCQEINTSNKFA